MKNAMIKLSKRIYSGIYRRYDGKEIQVIILAKNIDTGEEMLICKRRYYGEPEDYFTISKASFCETVDTPDGPKPKYTRQTQQREDDAELEYFHDLGFDQTDETQYEVPAEITLQLTHKDVFLDYFKDKKEIIFKLHSGMKLSLNEGYLYAELDGRTVRVAKLSKACVVNIETLEQKGYHPCGAEVRFVVAWKGEEDTEETAVLLPNLFFKKG